jgi:hypothetical protein
MYQNIYDNLFLNIYITLLQSLRKTNEPYRLNLLIKNLIDNTNLPLQL